MKENREFLEAIRTDYYNTYHKIVLKAKKLAGKDLKMPEFEEKGKKNIFKKFKSWKCGQFSNAGPAEFDRL